MEAGVSFIMAGSMSSKEIRKAMNLIKGKLSDPNQMKIYNGKPLFVSGLNVRIGSKDVSGYCYYMPSKAKEEEEGFYSVFTI